MSGSESLEAMSAIGVGAAGAGPIEGMAWVFGDNIDTDVIVPGKYLVHDLPEIAKHVMDGIRPGFAREISPGDIVVGGRNFGNGSSREMAPRGLQAAGVGAVVARSFARIFFRNCINVGLTPVECAQADRIEEGQRVSIDVAAGRLTVLDTGEVLEAVALPKEIGSILAVGGMENYLAATFKSGTGKSGTAK
ncbi:MAG: 3-isopropylmalate dehydratase small subunit [Acidimicrobiia bacterium]|nr:3-isopropylmalate dehydratase small subunit [Acidimicrobiia bacterium]